MSQSESRKSSAFYDLRAGTDDGDSVWLASGGERREDEEGAQTEWDNWAASADLPNHATSSAPFEDVLTASAPHPPPETDGVEKRKKESLRSAPLEPPLAAAESEGPADTADVQAESARSSTSEASDEDGDEDALRRQQRRSTRALKEKFLLDAAHSLMAAVSPVFPSTSDRGGGEMPLPSGLFSNDSVPEFTEEIKKKQLQFLPMGFSRDSNHPSGNRKSVAINMKRRGTVTKPSEATPCDVRVAVDFARVLSLDMKNETLTAEFHVSMSWTCSEEEDYREWRELKADFDLWGRPREKTLRKLWKPSDSLRIGGAVSSDLFKSSWVSPEKQPGKFREAWNIIGPFRFPMDLRNFPYDRQVFCLELVALKPTTELKLGPDYSRPHLIKVNAEMEMGEWVIADSLEIWEACASIPSSSSSSDPADPPSKEEEAIPCGSIFGLSASRWTDEIASSQTGSEPVSMDRLPRETQLKEGISGQAQRREKVIGLNRDPLKRRLKVWSPGRDMLISAGSKKTYDRVYTVVYLQRRPELVITSLMTYIWILTSCGFSYLALGPSSIEDRIQIIATFQLILVAYQYVVAADLPRKSYRTHLDKVIVAVFVITGGALLCTCSLGMLFRVASELEDTESWGWFDELGDTERWISQEIFICDIVLAAGPLISFLFLMYWDWKSRTNSLLSNSWPTLARTRGAAKIGNSLTLGK